MEKISIIVPVYKSEKYLDKCIESIVGQTYKNIEIIIVDDGSPDNCPKMCDEWAQKDNRIKVIHKENGGLSDARNKGIEIATGEYIGFVDSDDCISDKMYEKLLSMIINSDSDISMCQFARFKEGNSPDYTYLNDCVVKDKDTILKEVLIEKIGNHVCDKLFKRRLFNNNLFTKGVAYEDIFIFYKLVLCSNKIAMTNSKLYGYLQREDSITNHCTVKNVRDYINANNTRYEYLKNVKELEDYLNISMIKYVYVLHIKAVSTLDKEFFFSSEVLNEYHKVKKKIKLKYFKFHFSEGNFKTRVYKEILLLNRSLFWILMTRKKNKEGLNMKTEEKKVSIIAIAYNVEKYLDKCIDSLANQTYKNLEIILVDDGSSDDCPKICDEWAKKDDRIKVIHKKNGGVSDARNKGMEIATGDYIAFVDADDYLSKNMYEVLVDLLEKNDADMSVCQEVKFEENEEPKFTVTDKEFILEGSNEVLKNLFTKNDILNYVWNKLYRKELYDGIIFPYGESAQDISTVYKVIQKTNKVAVTKSKLYGYLQRKESAVHSCTPKYLSDRINASTRRYNDLKNNNEIIKYLNPSMAKEIYYCYVYATIANDKDFYDSKILVEKYEMMKELVNAKNIIYYLGSSNIKTLINKIILLMGRELFWKIRTRKSNKEKK